MTKSDGRGRRVHAHRSGEQDAAGRRPNGVLLLVLAAVAVIATVAGVLAATQRSPSYDPATPEGVVQTYLAAVIDRNHDEAARFLAAQSPCSVVDLDRAYLPDGIRVVLRDTQVTGDTARVDVDVAMPSGDLLGGSESFEKHTFRLTRSSEVWLITGEPWPMSDCRKA